MRKVLGSIADYFKHTDIIFWLLSIAVSVYGCLLIYSMDRADESSSFIKTQIMAVSLGYIAAILISVMDYSIIGKLWPIVAVICVGAVLLTFTPMGIQIAGTDDRAWIDLKVTTFQPAELMKIGFIITFAKHLSYLREKEKIKSFLQVCGLAGHALIPIVLVHFQGDDGTALVFALMFIIMSFAGGVQLRYFFITFSAIIAAAPLAWNFVMNEDQKNRFLALFNLEAYAQSEGWQQLMGKISIASGQMTGRGLFQGPRVAKGSVPFQENDFIFSVAGEELGFVGCIALLGLLLLLMLRAVQNAGSAKDYFGKFICFGFFAMISVQTCINVGMCLGLLPVVGITLPFFSSGGSSVACLYLGIGLVESVYMHQYDPDKIKIRL